MSVQIWQWILIIVSSLILFLLSPWAKSSDQFFKATHRKKAPSGLWLT
ncbi:MAG: sodium:solute symporter, partial [Marinirhabdus sp.]|nr:sodium:solute symporter [Marinirhabdus sp.]